MQGQIPVTDYVESSSDIIKLMVVIFNLQTSFSAPDDYNEVTQVLTFSPGTTQLTVNVRANGDQVVEEDENFNAILSSPSAGARLGQATASVTIQDLTGRAT